MPTSLRSFRSLPLLGILLLGFGHSLFGQGITASGLNGFVSDQAGQPIAGATVTIVHEPSSTRATAMTRANGRYDVSGLRVGGPYTVTVTTGSGNEVRNEVYLELGEGSTINFTIGAPAVL